MKQMTANVMHSNVLCRKAGLHGPAWIRGRLFRYVLAALLPLWGLAAPGMLVADTLRLATSETIARAISGGPEILRQRVRVERARAERRGIGGFLPALPELELEGASDAPFKAEGEREWGVMLSQEIEIGGQSFLRRAAADAAVAQAELETRAVELELHARARVLHARLAAAQDQVRLIGELAAFSRRLDTIAARLLEVGEISELDRNTVGIGAAGAEMELVQAGAELAEARTELHRLLGVPAGTIVVAMEPEFPSSRAAIAAVLDAVAQVETALAAGDDRFIRERPDWQALEQGLERYRTERRLAGRWAVPNLHLGVGVTGERRSVESGDGHSHGPASLTEHALLGLRLGIQLPLPGVVASGQGNIGVADAEIAALEADRRMLMAGVGADLERAASRLRAAATTLALCNERIVPMLERNRELVERGYAAGELTATQTVTQQEQLLRSSESLVRARREYAEAFAEFERIIGR